MAQLNTGSISGQVTDPNGALVPGINVQLAEQRTGIERSAQTNDTGFYTFPLVPVGIYQLTVGAPGFKKYIQNEQRRLSRQPGQLLGLVSGSKFFAANRHLEPHPHVQSHAY